jgi:hypothetical protein
MESVYRDRCARPDLGNEMFLARIQERLDHSQ